MSPDCDSKPDQEAAEGYVPLRWVEEANAERDRLRAENERLREALDDQRRRLEPDGAGGFRWEAADQEAQITWLRNQMGDVRGMQSDGATPEEMDEALGRALAGERARQAFDESRRSTDEIRLTQSDGSEVSAARGSEDAVEPPDSNPGHGGSTTRAAQKGDGRG